MAALYWITSFDYYKYEASSADACAPGEEYDEEYGFCYFDFHCETEEECAAVDERYGQALDDLAGSYLENEMHLHNPSRTFSGHLEAGEREKGSEPDEEIERIIRLLVPQYIGHVSKIVVEHTRG